MAKQKQKKKTPAKKRKHKKQAKRPLFWRALRWLFVLGIWGGIALAGIIVWYAKDLPDITQSATFERRSSIVVMASDGKVLARYGEQKGKNIEVDYLPAHLVNAVIATEDRRFYEHYGVDPLGIARAMAINIYKGRLVQGGSTITQQLAKNLFLSHQRKLARKIQEALLALWLEQQLSKEEILSAYMNRVYLGSGTYGFEAAAQLYFGKSAYDVNIREAAVLAGLLKAPSRYSPHNNIKLAKKRSDVVIAAMIDAGLLEENQLTPSQMTLSLPHKKSKTEQNVRYFTDWVLDGLDDIVGRPDMDMVVETTLDSALQNAAQSRLAAAIDNADDMHFVSQGAVLSMRPDGAILAMAGGYNYGQSQFNRVTQARRPPGSAFKPFVYLAAIEQGWDANDKILDAPITDGEYRPKNFANKYFGSVDLKTALAKSLNTATVRLTEEIGIASVLKTAKKLGIIAKLQRDLSLSLGSSGVPMLEMGTAYAAIANGGHRVFPYAIKRITDGAGRELYVRKVPTSYPRIIKSGDVQELRYMMQAVITEGTGRAAALPFPAAGKTGTSQDSRDAWFAGYTDKMVSVVWLGNDDNSPMRNITGGGLPARIWHDIMFYGNDRQSAISFKNTTPNNSDGGFSGMFDRLFSGGDERTADRRKKNKDDFSNLND